MSRAQDAPALHSRIEAERIPCTGCLKRIPKPDRRFQTRPLVNGQKRKSPKTREGPVWMVTAGSSEIASTGVWRRRRPPEKAPSYGGHFTVGKCSGPDWELPRSLAAAPSHLVASVSMHLPQQRESACSQAFPPSSFHLQLAP